MDGGIGSTVVAHSHLRVDICSFSTQGVIDMY
jgi:hypothetical protein